jgi:hypothetical protein
MLLFAARRRRQGHDASGHTAAAQVPLQRRYQVNAVTLAAACKSAPAIRPRSPRAFRLRGPRPFRSPACKSTKEAIEWIKRCPNPHNEESEIEIRLEDCGASEAAEHHSRLRPDRQEVNRLSYPASRLPNNGSALPVTRGALIPCLLPAPALRTLRRFPMRFGSWIASGPFHFDDLTPQPLCCDTPRICCELLSLTFPCGRKIRGATARPLVRHRTAAPTWHAITVRVRYWTDSQTPAPP